MTLATYSVASIYNKQIRHLVVERTWFEGWKFIEKFPIENRIKPYPLRDSFKREETNLRLFLITILLGKGNPTNLVSVWSEKT